MTKDEAMKLALEALENHSGNYKLSKTESVLYKNAVDALRQALEQPDPRPEWMKGDLDINKALERAGQILAQPEQEPVVLNQFLSDVMTAAGLVKHGKQSKALAARLQVEVMRLHTALRAALEQPEQEPFGYFHYDLGLELWQETGTGDGKPLYAAPPKPADDLIVGYAESHDINRAGHDFWVSRQPGKNTVPLYLYGQPPKIWQGLTDEEIEVLYDQAEHHHGEFNYWFDHNSFARAIEAKLKEKNRG